jgi:surfeit locus 1 family protein
MTTRTKVTTPAVRPGGWRLLVAPGLATLVALGILIALGTWQLQRKAWKEDLIQQVESRSHGEPGAILPEASWGDWQASRDEFRRVRVTGRFQHADETPVYGLAPTEMRGAPVQGYFVMTPLRLADGALVFVNRGFVPTGLRDPAARPGSQPDGEVTVTGLVRAPEARNAFTPADDPGKNTWFSRDPPAIARARGLARAAPFYVEADATPNPGNWPKGGQSRLNLPNDHLQYALTWFGLALTLVGVFTAFAIRALKPRTT